MLVTDKKVKNEGTLGWLKQSVHRGRNDIFSEVKMVTPQLAEVILTQNPDNRKIRPIKFDQMVLDMKHGRWTMNGEPIIIANTGELNDGQHRLMALIEANVTLPLLFVFGVERESRTTVDQGAPRYAGDYLQMQGVVSANQQASIARNLIAYERATPGTRWRIQDITSAEVVERVKKDITIATSTRWSMSHYKHFRRYVNTTVIGICHNILLNKNTTDGLAFLEVLASGEGLHRGDAIYVARERLLNMDHKTIFSCTEVIFRAWNAYREKRPMKTIPIHGRLPELI